jgi:hypothetical protein
MANIANLPKLHYCNKKCSNTAKCSGIATLQVCLKSKAPKDGAPESVLWEYRCDDHATTGTSSKVVSESRPFDQTKTLEIINKYLTSLIGRNIKSKAHTALMLRVKYIKFDKGGVMCFQEHSKKWKFVYYEQITQVLY